MARRRITPEAQARADRIAAALSGLLDEAPIEPVSVSDGTEDPYRPVPKRPTATAKAAFPCPRCGHELHLHYAKGAEIHRCGECLGFWLGPRRLEEMIEEPDDAPPVNVGALRARMKAMVPNDPTVRYRTCPHCRGRMNRRNYGDVSGVIVDECTRHGLFLDPGEFEAIEAFIQLGGLRAQRKHLAERERVAAQERARAAARAGAANPFMARHQQGFWSSLFGFSGAWD